MWSWVRMSAVYTVRRGEERLQGHRTLLIRGGESQDKARKIMRGQGMIMIDEAKDNVTKACLAGDRGIKVDKTRYLSSRELCAEWWVI